MCVQEKVRRRHKATPSGDGEGIEKKREMTGVQTIGEINKYADDERILRKYSAVSVMSVVEKERDVRART